MNWHQVTTKGSSTNFGRNIKQIKVNYPPDP